MELAIYIALIIISTVLVILVIAQTRTPGMANRDAGSIHRTKRGLEKTLHQATVVVSASFLVLVLFASLPIY